MFAVCPIQFCYREVCYYSDTYRQLSERAARDSSVGVVYCLRDGLPGNLGLSPGRGIFFVLSQVSRSGFPKLFHSRTPFWLRKITTHPHIPAHLHTESG